MDKLNALRVIGNKLRKCIFADRVTNAVSECVMVCVSEYEELMMRIIAKNERLIGKIDECEKMLTQKEMMQVRRTQVWREGVPVWADQTRMRGCVLLYRSRKRPMQLL